MSNPFNLPNSFNNPFQMTDLSSQQTTDQINQLIAQSADALMCGPSCQQAREASSLQQAYVNAQANVDTAPAQLQQAEQNYYTYTQGTAGYNTIRANSATTQAADAASSAAATFQAGVDSATELTNTYNSLHITYQNTFDLYQQYLNKNAALQGEISQINTDTVTNDRKTYYESQGYNKLQSWHTVFRWIYIILLVVYVIGMVVVGSSYSFMAKIFILLALIIYPFVINNLLLFIYSSFLHLYSLLPKNAYTTIEQP